jgi:DNA recombination protein RmuC
MTESVSLVLALGMAGAALLLGVLITGLALRMRYRDRIVELQTLLQQEKSQTQEKLTVLTQAREELRAQFRVLASDVLDEKTRRFSETSRQGLGDILSPLQEKITRFEKKVDDTYNREARERFSLEKEIKNLQLLNARISEDALNLTRALKVKAKPRAPGANSFSARYWKPPDSSRGSNMKPSAVLMQHRTTIRLPATCDAVSRM